MTQRAIVAIIGAAGCLMIGALFSGLIPAVQFRREWITVTVRPEAFEVSGVYEYVNPWPVATSQGLTIPFPVDVRHPAPATVRVRRVSVDDGRDMGPIPVRWLAGKPRFTVFISAHGRVHARVEYVQRSTDGTGTYLLTTTRPWGRSLDYGEYTMYAECVRLDRSNYPLGGADGRTFVRERFMPEHDWRFAWTARKECSAS